MRILKNLFAFYITGSIHVALAVTALAVISAIHLNISPDADLLFFIFFGAVTGYNFIKFAGIAKLHHRSLAKNLRMIQVFSLFCFIALIYFAFQIKTEVLLVTGLFGILTLLYALPFFGQRNLRTIGGIKIYIIAFIWAGVSVICPVVSAEHSLSTDVILEFFQRVLFVLVLLIPFEIRDLKYDQADLKTLPQNIGVKGAQTTGIAFLCAMVAMEFFKTSATLASTVGVIFISIVTGILVVKAKEDQSPKYSSFWVEGLPLMWLGLLLLLKYLF